MLTRVTIAAGLVLLLAACGGEDKPAEGTADVASLTATSGAAAPSASSGAQERPLERPDATQEEIARMYAVFDGCMEQNGFPQKDGSGTLNQKAAAEKICGHLQPETAFQRSQRLDPAHYGDRLRDWVTCIRSHGIDAYVEDDNLFFESLPAGEDAERVAECQTKAFAEVLEGSA
ncbi:hypothetical protein ACIA8K_27740 [Catenuloplanes sp. NPDC051500]|uniref:hypothetical protein n=1 Tax=Catenuloplanes sp. NPDC051500 TaxID=3363959 RepID=UPI0037A7894B